MTMKSLRFIAAMLSALLLVPWAAPALAQADIAATSAADASAVRPALWKIADKDTTIWLFGTIHILPESLDWYSASVAAALEGSDVLVTEVPVDSAARARGILMQTGVRGDARSLRSTLPDELRAKYEAALAGLELPPSAFDKNDAWYAAVALSLLPLQKNGYNLANGIDSQVARKAEALGLANAALETPEQQLALFEGLPAATQNRYLAEVVDSIPNIDADVTSIVTAWKTGDAEGLARLLNDQEDDPVMRKALLTDRNAAWAKWLKARLDEPGTVFVAVGAGHLAGKGSVQDKLAAMGVRTARVQ